MPGAPVLLALLLMHGVGLAETATSAPPPRFLLGASLFNAPEYSGARHSEARLRPVWAYQHGRFRVSTSRAGGLLGFGGEAGGSGASAELISGERIKLGLALRVDGGRSSGDSPRLAGLPDVRRTLRGRLYAGYALNRQWSVSAGLSQDLMGRGGGATLGLGLGYRARLGERSEWSAGAGINIGDRRHLRSYYGISAQAAESSGLARYRPGASASDLHAGLGLTTALGPHWVAFASLGVSQLLADAAASPLTERERGFTGAVGLAYRWGAETRR